MVIIITYKTIKVFIKHFFLLSTFTAAGINIFLILFLFSFTYEYNNFVMQYVVYISFILSIILDYFIIVYYRNY